MTAEGERGTGGGGRGTEEDAVPADQQSKIQNPKSKIADSVSPVPLPPSAFRLLLDPPASGPWNMAVDEVLLEAAAATGQCTLRFYQWDRPTLSLGYFQTYADRWQHEASRHAAAVRRMSGGGAIMHDLELTYSLAITSQHPLAVDRLGLYRAMHAALIAVLAERGVKARMFSDQEKGGQGPGEKSAKYGVRSTEEVASGQWLAARGQRSEIGGQRSEIGGQKSEVRNQKSEIRNPKSQISNPQSPIPNPSPAQPFLCFQRRSPGDVLVGEWKIAGSAQRRCLGAVLQHGSVLLARSAAAPELDGLAELVDKTIEPQDLAQAWLAQLGTTLPITWTPGGLSEEQRQQVARLASEKYASSNWTENRGRG
jgi:lipoate-protein ligase A